MLSQTLKEASDGFIRFAEDETVRSSTLYSSLATNIAQDEELLALAMNSAKAQRELLLLASVHFLLLKGAQSPLRNFYATLGGVELSPGDAFPYFRKFCLDHSNEIIPLLKTKKVQTNEVRRCACLLPAFTTVLKRTDNAPLFLVEIGPSAGLNLLWDQYAHRYSDGSQFGEPASPVILTCENRGSTLLPLPTQQPVIAGRVGLELHPVNLDNPDESLWLQALVWPDQTERLKRLRNAMELAKRHPIEIVSGDVLETLESVLSTIPEGATPCIYHSFVLYQFSHESILELEEKLKMASHRNDLFCIGMGNRDKKEVEIWLDTYSNGERNEETLAICQGHGAWIDWK